MQVTAFCLIIVSTIRYYAKDIQTKWSTKWWILNPMTKLIIMLGMKIMGYKMTLNRYVSEFQLIMKLMELINIDYVLMLLGMC